MTPEMQRRYAKEIKSAKLDEFNSYLDNGALRLADKRKLSKDINFLTGRWVLTVKVDKNGFFSKFKARWVCRGFQDKHAWGSSRPTVLLLLAMDLGWLPSVLLTTIGICFIWTSRLPSLQGEHYNTESRSCDHSAAKRHRFCPPWMVGVCLRPVYGLNDAPRRWWNRLDKFLVSIGLEPTRADRCTYVGYQGIESQKT